MQDGSANGTKLVIVWREEQRFRYLFRQIMGERLG